MKDVRIEVDLLGEREVPNEAYWGIHSVQLRILTFQITQFPMCLSLCVVW